MICLRKKRKKWISWFFGWKLGGFDIFRGQFLKIFKKNPKNLTSPVNIKCFNLKNHHQLKKKILSTKKWRQIYSSSGPTGPPPGTQRVKTGCLAKSGNGWYQIFCFFVLHYSMNYWSISSYMTHSSRFWTSSYPI